MTTLTFQNTELSVINHNDQIWFTTSEVGKGLGYPHPVKAIQKIFDRHQDEFTPCMTALIDMQTAGGMQKVRIFSLRGCHLIGMLSHTKVAKDFRRWVLDILDREVAETTPKTTPVAEPEPKPDVVIPYEDAEFIADYIVKVRVFAKEVELFHRKLYENLGIQRGIRNNLAAQGYDIAHEFNYWLDPFVDRVLPKTKPNKPYLIYNC